MTGNLFGWSDEFWRILDQIGILVGDFTLIVSLFLAGVGFLRRDRIRRWLTRNRFPEVGALDIEGMTWDGIVFTVSHEETPLWVMQQLKPGAVAFIASEQSRASAAKLRETARSLDIGADLPIQTVDPDDPAQSRRAAAALLAKMRQAGAEKLAVDVTGGKTPMSLGAFMAAEECGAGSLYVASQFDSRLKRPDMHTATLRCISRPEE
jgi:hypothetical protein